MVQHAPAWAYDNNSRLLVGRCINFENVMAIKPVCKWSQVQRRCDGYDCTSHLMDSSCSVIGSAVSKPLQLWT
jgi:hypothetical protein